VKKRGTKDHESKTEKKSRANEKKKKPKKKKRKRTRKKMKRKKRFVVQRRSRTRVELDRELPALHSSLSLLSCRKHRGSDERLFSRKSDPAHP